MTLDYSALAKQFGGTTVPSNTQGGSTVDYSALAKQYGGSTVAPTATPTVAAPQNGGVLGQGIKEGVSSLGKLYGGGSEGIASKLGSDVQAGANDIQSGAQQGGLGGLGTAIKGIAKAGLRTAGDVAGTIYAPISAAIGATGIGKVFDQAGSDFANAKIGQAITDNPAVQSFAVSHPNAGEDFGRALNLAFASKEKGTIEPSTVVDRTATQVGNIKNAVVAKAPDVLTKSVDQMRSEKIASGFAEQNSRLKSADRSFNENTRTTTSPDGTKTKITPIDTFTKYNITPTVENGGIQMGDYKTGTGALGKIKEHVGNIDSMIDKSLKDTGRGVSISDFKQSTINAIKSDPTLRQSGKVASTVAKLGAIFDDFKNSYGGVLQETEINRIRQTMNQDWHPDTMDVSKIVGDAARKIVYNSTPDQIVKTLLEEQGNLLAAKNYANKINGTKVTGGRLGNMAMRTAGALVGSTLHNLPVLGPLAGMVGGEYLSRAMQQTQFKSVGAEAKAVFQSKSK